MLGLLARGPFFNFKKCEKVSSLLPIKSREDQSSRRLTKGENFAKIFFEEENNSQISARTPY